MATTSNTGREYLRVSKDRSGRQRSVGEQHEDNDRAAADRGVTLGEPYAENGAVSASRYGKRARGGFAQLLADLHSGRFDADELWLWESSRGSRDVGEWVDVIEACERAGVKVYVTTHARLYDPANARDRRSLLEDAVDSEYESAKTSARSRRAHAALATSGRPNGSAPFGYRRRYDPLTRVPVGQDIEPVEAGVIRELFERIAAGDSLTGIAADFAARGIRSRTGKALTMQYLRKWATLPSYAGRRVHQPHGGGPVTTVPADWPAIVDPVLYDRVQHILTDPARKTRRPGRANHLLSMIARCDVCGDVLTCKTRLGVWWYVCRTGGHVRVEESELDTYAERVMFAYLARPDVADMMTAAATSGPDLDHARAELAAVRAELESLYAEVAARRLSASALAAIEPGLLAQAEQLETQVRELSAPPALAGIITPGPGARNRWASLPMAARREVARILLSPDLLGELRIGRPGVPAGSHVRVPVHDRATWRRAGAEPR